MTPMNLKNQRPIFVPDEFCREIEGMTKAALMDLVWDFATTSVDGEATDANVMNALRSRAEIVLGHRKQAYAK